MYNSNSIKFICASVVYSLNNNTLHIFCLLFLLYSSLSFNFPVSNLYSPQPALHTEPRYLKTCPTTKINYGTYPSIRVFLGMSSLNILNITNYIRPGIRMSLFFDDMSILYSQIQCIPEYLILLKHKHQNKDILHPIPKIKLTEEKISDLNLG